ncbi:NADH dehydrogenase [ubiquinone] 1 alpha subcomplex assembly factor 8 isoform X1 [Erinaceus europaeus]|uniref:NADH dehydrogenase [ubiquinone] 1 alpha subcomplex assembly factor 8 isoform X1 n=1 Tax=Erinaceus europaeus TaxID=9365 RepID=A0ABM3VTW5_ERIEU|nr:NADH dehydrogenase [ubiquinone] 1 alpha subcomplex assembly factor 8 isoform X1 [Erinaceus europaeus]
MAVPMGAKRRCSCRGTEWCGCACETVSVFSPSAWRPAGRRPCPQAAAYGRCVQASTAPGSHLRKDLCVKEFEALRSCFVAALLLRTSWYISVSEAGWPGELNHSTPGPAIHHGHQCLAWSLFYSAVLAE